MTDEEALKKVQATKENYMTFELSYDKKIILPYKDGIAFLVALSKAEQLKEPYGGEQHRITEFNRDTISARLLSHDEYIRIKIAALLGVKPEEVNPEVLVA